MKTKLLILSTILISIVLLAAVSSNAKIYINNYPADITVNEGDPVDVPLFFAGGDFTGMPVEIYVIKRDHNNANITEYFDLSTNSWIPTTDDGQLKPMAKIDQMIEYVYLVWEAIDNSTGVNSFDLNVCMDGNIDGKYEPETCSKRLVDIIKSESPVCTGLTLNPPSITQTLERGKSLTVTINVNDSCGPADFTATTSSLSWISVPNTGKGVLDVTLDSSSLAANQTYEGDISISSAGGSTQTLKVSLTVDPPVFDWGGGCTGSSISIWPVSISSAAGETKTGTTNIKNNCGKALPYTASVTSGSGWLSVPKSGTGTITVTTNASGLPGTQDGTIKVSSSGYPDATLHVTLTVTGECVAKNAVISPSPISISASPGNNIADVTVTVKDNCGTGLNYTIKGVSPAASWIILPALNDSGTGSFTVSFDKTKLSTGTNNGSITLDHSYGSTTIPVSITVTNVVSQAVLLGNNAIKYYSYDPGQVRDFYFYENSNKDPKNDNSLQFEMMDMIQTYQYNVDMIVKYAGASCEPGEIPTESDYQYCLNKWKNGSNCLGDEVGGNKLYSRLSSTAFENIEITNNPEGCYYIRIKNVDTKREDKISIKYSDYDSVFQ